MSSFFFHYPSKETYIDFGHCYYYMFRGIKARAVGGIVVINYIVYCAVMLTILFSTTYGLHVEGR